MAKTDIIRVMQLPIKDSDFNSKIESRKKELGLDSDASYLKFLIAKDCNKIQC